MIKDWLDEFKSAWISKDTDRVLDLFTIDVEYWETPYIRLENRDRLKQEWAAVQKQHDIDLDLQVFSSMDDKFSILWKLRYFDASSVEQNWAGTYLIKLDTFGKCSYFYQTGEKR